MAPVQLHVKSKGPELNFSRFRVKLHPTTSSSNHYSIMLRTPLGSISGNRPRGPELTPYKRGIITGAYKHSCTPKYIASAENTALTTVKKTIYTTSQPPNGITNPRRGRPPVTTIQDRRLIIRIARRNPRIIYKDLKQETSLTCSSSTFYRILKKYGLTNWLAKQRLLLTPKVAAKRLVWCRARLS